MIFKIIYNIWFHPLSKFPGPKYAAASDFFYSKTVVGGESHTVTQKLHEQYGDVVRVAPDELSFASASAWKDIYATRSGVVGGSPFLKGWDPTMDMDKVFVLTSRRSEVLRHG